MYGWSDQAPTEPGRYRLRLVLPTGELGEELQVEVAFEAGALWVYPQGVVSVQRMRLATLKAVWRGPFVTLRT